MLYLKRFNTSGFSLVEVMISAALFSIGLVAVMEMQTKGLKMQHDSMTRQSANQLAINMAERMRANHADFKLGSSSAYNNAAASEAGNPACLGKDNAGADLDTTCTAAQMAAHDFYEWNSALAGRAADTWHPAVSAKLPSGQGIVCIDSTPNDGTPAAPACDNTISVASTPVFAIKVWWTERKDQAASTRRFVMSVSP